MIIKGFWESKDFQRMAYNSGLLFLVALFVSVTTVQQCHGKINSVLYIL